MHEKQFDTWNAAKQLIEKTGRMFFVHPRDVWWCALGVNIGAETDGKNNNFERPIIVIKAYNRDTVLVLPLTSKTSDNPFHFPVTITGKIQWVRLTQVRVVSTKRLLRKVGVLDEDQFLRLKGALIRTLDDTQ